MISWKELIKAIYYACKFKKNKLDQFPLKYFHKDFHFVQGLRHENFIHEFELNKSIVEIGVQRGDFSNILYKNLAPTELVLIDCFEKQEKCLYEYDAANNDDHNMNYDICKNRFKNNHEIKIIKAYSTILNEYPDSYFDIAYIDGDHTFSGALNDLKMCNRVVKSTGFIAGDDFEGWYTLGYNDTAKYTGNAFGVLSALKAFMDETKWKLYVVNNSEWNHNYILKYENTI